MEGYEPPFHMTDRILNLVAEISEQVGRITVLARGSLNPHLRKKNRIRTIHSSLAIENNSLSLEQVTALVDGKRILGNPNEIREVKNAYETYQLMLSLDPGSVADLLKAHKIMMQGLIPENGEFRSGSVGVFDGTRVVHVAPPAQLVPQEVEALFAWYKASGMHPLIKSAIFHYEFEFIHPFADGNGRMGRLWHSMLLGQWKELFYWVPVEELIQKRQKDYYDKLHEADVTADSAPFVELLLALLAETLQEIHVVGREEALPPRVQQLLEALDGETLSAAELMGKLGITQRLAFRRQFLQPALEMGLVEMTLPDKPTSRNQRYRRK